MTPAVPTPPGGWTFRLTPYAWLTSLDGTFTGAAGRSVRSSASFVDLVEDSDQLVPFMGYYQAQYDRFTIFGDVFYSKIGFPNSNDVQKNPVAGLTISRSTKDSRHLDARRRAGRRGLRRRPP